MCRELLPVPRYADLIGKPYRFGAQGPDEYDCYGLIRELHARLGNDIPNPTSEKGQEAIAAAMASYMNHWELCQPGQGATVAIRIGRYVSHCGFMVSDSRMIHAWEGSKGVVIEGMADWDRRIVGYYKYKKNVQNVSAN